MLRAVVWRSILPIVLTFVFEARLSNELGRLKKESAAAKTKEEAVRAAAKAKKERLAKRKEAKREAKAMQLSFSERLEAAAPRDGSAGLLIVGNTILGHSIANDEPLYGGKCVCVGLVDVGPQS